MIINVNGLLEDALEQLNHFHWQGKMRFDIVENFNLPTLQETHLKSVLKITASFEGRPEIDFIVCELVYESSQQNLVGQQLYERLLTTLFLSGISNLYQSHVEICRKNQHNEDFIKVAKYPLSYAEAVKL